MKSEQIILVKRLAKLFLDFFYVNIIGGIFISILLSLGGFGNTELSEIFELPL